MTFERITFRQWFGYMKHRARARARVAIRVVGFASILASPAILMGMTGL